ncbi:MAG: phosphoglycolate phosphatase [Xanthomonadales bacterium]|nr:phosphoglycolate phosphatase [Xanthomonadales bacterium]
MTDRIPEAVLFDLDGTLADTAPDLIAALERLRLELGLPAIETGPLRECVGRGAVAVLEGGLPELGPADREAFRARFLDDYQARCWEASRPFDGMPDFLDDLESLNIPWGVVTNKLERFARPVMERAGWSGRMGCLVAGDTVTQPKPAPEPVLAACSALGVDPARAVFIGDDERDVIAGRAAGTRTVAALWGYIAEPDRVDAWGADAIAEAPGVLTALLELRCPRAAV